MYDLLAGYTIADEGEDLTPAERQQLQARAEADAQLSVQSGGSRAAARWTKEIAVSSSAKPTRKRRLEKLPNPVDVIPLKVAPPHTQKRSSKEQESLPTASSSHHAEPSRKFLTKAPPPIQKRLSIEPESAPMASSSRCVEPSRKSSTKALPPTQKHQSKEPVPVPTAPSSNHPKSSRKASTKVPKSAPMIVDSNSDNSVDIPPPTRKESGASTKKSHSELSVPRKAPDHTSSSKLPRPAPVNVASEMHDGVAPSTALDPDLRQAVLLDIQAIVARHMAYAARAPHQEFGGQVDEESIASNSARRDDGDVVMVDRNQDESWSEGEMVTQESPQIPSMSEKQKGKQREVDSASASLDDVEMRDVDDELTGLGASRLVGDLSTSSGFLSVDDQSFYEDQGMEYDDGELGVIETLDDGTGPSPWTTDGSASRPDSPRDVDNGAPSNEHAPRTPQAGQRRDRQFFSGMPHSFLSVIFNN